MVPGQRAGSGKAAAGFRSRRAFGQAGARRVQEDRPLWGGAGRVGRGRTWVVPGQRAGSGKAAAGFRSPRAFGRAVRDEYKKTDLFGGGESALRAPASPAQAGQIQTKHGHRCSECKKTDLFEGAAGASRGRDRCHGDVAVDGGTQFNKKTDLFRGTGASKGRDRCEGAFRRDPRYGCQKDRPLRGHAGGGGRAGRWIKAQGESGLGGALNGVRVWSGFDLLGQVTPAL